LLLAASSLLADLYLVITRKGTIHTSFIRQLYSFIFISRANQRRTLLY